MELIKFIFSSFWVWLGTALLLSAVISGIVSLARGCDCQALKEEIKELKKEA